MDPTRSCRASSPSSKPGSKPHAPALLPSVPGFWGDSTQCDGRLARQSWLSEKRVKVFCLGWGAPRWAPPELPPPQGSGGTSREGWQRLLPCPCSRHPQQCERAKENRKAQRCFESWRLSRSIVCPQNTSSGSAGPARGQVCGLLSRVPPFPCHSHHPHTLLCLPAPWLAAGRRMLT